MDDSRRAHLLAEVGAHASAEPTQIASAPTHPAAAIAAASRAPTPTTPSLEKVAGTVVAAPQPSSLKGVRGDAFTELAATGRGSSFGKVTSDAYVSYAKVSAAKTTAKANKGAGIENKLEAKRKLADAAKKPGRTYRVGAGETLYSIARKQGVEVAQIRSWNHLKDNTVRTGQVLHIESR